MSTHAELRATAYHEAGHAVVSLALGLEGIHKVSIIPDEDYLSICFQAGVMMYHAETKKERRNVIRDCIIGTYAGMPAQRLVDPNPREYHGEDDENAAFQLSREREFLPRRCGHVGSDWHLALLDKLRKKAGRLVRRHRMVIAAVAEELLHRRELSGEEVRQIVAGTLPPLAEPLAAKTKARPRGRPRKEK